MIESDVDRVETGENGIGRGIGRRDHWDDRTRFKRTNITPAPCELRGDAIGMLAELCTKEENILAVIGANEQTLAIVRLSKDR